MKSYSLIKVLLLALIISSCSIPSTSTRVDQKIHIHDIQGCGHYSPLEGKTVEDVPGIVTSRVNNGFYLQETKPDDRFCSSEAIFIFTQSYPDVRPGDKVEVSGVVEEYYPGDISNQNLPVTEIVLKSFRKVSEYNDLPVAFEIDGSTQVIPEKVIDDDGLRNFEPESDGIDYFESLESMLVSVKAGIVVGARNEYNEVVVITKVNQREEQISEEGALLLQPDDRNPERIILNLSSINTSNVNVGETLDGPVTGILDYSYGNYKINTFGEVPFSGGDRFKVDPIYKSPGSITLASLNLENLAPDSSMDKFLELSEMISNDLGSPEILVIHEIMDDSGSADDQIVSADKTIGRLIDTITNLTGVNYEYLQVNPVNNKDGGVPGGNIRSVILYRSESDISKSNSRLLQQNPMRLGEGLNEFSNTRKPLMVNLTVHGKEVVIIAAHLTSRGADSPIFGEAQPISEPEKEKRESQARIINQFASTLVEKSPDVLVWVVGDMNDYHWSKTLDNLQGQDTLKDLGETLEEEDRFSYILDGNAFQFDYILVSNQLSLDNYRFMIPHLNTLLDRKLQSSDHDPVWMEFILP